MLLILERLLLQTRLIQITNSEYNYEVKRFAIWKPNVSKAKGK